MSETMLEQALNDTLTMQIILLGITFILKFES